MWQSVYLLWKTEVYNFGCVFAYFCGRHKNNTKIIFENKFKNETDDYEYLFNTYDKINKIINQRPDDLCKEVEETTNITRTRSEKIGKRSFRYDDYVMNKTSILVMMLMRGRCCVYVRIAALWFNWLSFISFLCHIVLWFTSDLLNMWFTQ